MAPVVAATPPAKKDTPARDTVREHTRAKRNLSSPFGMTAHTWKGPTMPHGRIDPYSGPEDELALTANAFDVERMKAIIALCPNRWHITESQGAHGYCPECPLVVPTSTKHTIISGQLCITCEPPHIVTYLAAGTNTHTAPRWRRPAVPSDLTDEEYLSEEYHRGGLDAVHAKRRLKVSGLTDSEYLSEEYASGGTEAIERIRRNSAYGREKPEFGGTVMDRNRQLTTSASECNICGQFPHIPEVHREYYKTQTDRL